MHGLKKQSGIAALLTIIIVSVSALIMAYSATVLGLGELDMGYDSQKGGEAFAIADGCVEEGLRRLRLDPTYTGDSLNLGNGSCIMSISTSGSDRIITATSTLDVYHKKVQVNLTLSGTNLDIITVNSWAESN